MDGVILLHGIARSSASLRKLEQNLKAAGFATLNLDYPSRKHSLDGLVERIHRDASGFIARRAAPLHFVTHSMGGLLARAYIARYRPANLGRVVMLAPPNQGSEIADLLGTSLFYNWYFGPAGKQLGTRSDTRLRTLLGTVDYPLGIIAGDRAIDPLGWLLVPRPNDGRVAVVRTKVSGMADHVTLHATHALMMRNAEVIRHAIAFLRSGRFPVRWYDDASGIADVRHREPLLGGVAIQGHATKCDARLLPLDVAWG